MTQNIGGELFAVYPLDSDENKRTTEVGALFENWSAHRREIATLLSVNGFELMDDAAEDEDRQLARSFELRNRRVVDRCELFEEHGGDVRHAVAEILEHQVHPQRSAANRFAALRESLHSDDRAALEAWFATNNVGGFILPPVPAPGFYRELPFIEGYDAKAMFARTCARYQGKGDARYEVIVTTEKHGMLGITTKTVQEIVSQE